MSAPESPGKSSESTERRPVSIVVLIILAALVIGLIFGQDYLPDPYYALTHLATYGLAVVVVWRQLGACRRLAGTAERRSKLFSVGFWLVCAVVGLLSRVNEIYHSTDQHAVRLATDISLLLALWSALVFVEQLLKSATDEEPQSPET